MALDVVAAAESVVVFDFVEVGLAIGMILLVDRDKDFFGWEFVRLKVLQDATEADEFRCHGWLLDVVVQSTEERLRLPVSTTIIIVCVRNLARAVGVEKTTEFIGYHSTKYYDSSFLTR